MFVEAIKEGDKYILPIKGKKNRIKVYIDEDLENIDVRSLLVALSTADKDYKELSKDEFREMYGEELYRKYLLLDEKTMEEEWEFLVRTKHDWGEGFEFIEEAVSDWSGE